MNTEEDGQPATQQAPEETPLNFNKLIMNFLVVTAAFQQYFMSYFFAF